MSLTDNPLDEIGLEILWDEDPMLYLETFADDIPIHAQIDGRWQNLSLAELPGKLALEHAFRFLRDHQQPVIRLRQPKGNDNAAN